MLPGPLFRVELVAAARQRRYYLLRVLYAAIILFTLWVSYQSMSMGRYGADEGASISQMAETAKAFFSAFSWIQLIGILAVGPAMAVGTIATERERRTIEYLFTTDLSNLEIVLGKTFARLLVVGKFVLVSLPILFLFRMLGGIPADMLAASFLISASTALFLTSMSVCVSVWAVRSRDAAMRVYLILFALIVLPPIVTTMAMVLGFGSGMVAELLAPAMNFLRDLNPLWVLGTAMSGVYSGGAPLNFGPVYYMVGYHVVLSIALVALATAAVRRVHLRESSAGAPKKKADGATLRRRWLPRWRPGIGDNAMLWKEAFAPTSRAKLGIVAGAANVLVVVAAMGLILYLFIQSLWNEGVHRDIYFEFSSTFTGVIGTGLLLMLAARASGLVTMEKERDSWVSLLATPLTGGEIMRGKMLGNLFAARWGFFLLLFSAALGIVLDIRYLPVVAAQSLAFAVCAWFVTNLGLFFSLRSTTSLRAMGMTLGVGSFVGGAYLFCCCPLMALGGGPGGGGDEFMLGLAPCMPFLIAAPSVVYVQTREIYSVDIPGEIIAALVVGLVGYAIASALFMSYFAHQADQAAGRTTESPGAHEA